MNESLHYLEHAGIVMQAQEGRVKILLTGSGCSACHKSLCMLGESKAKEVDLRYPANTLQPGDEVLVKINPASGYKAVVLLYLIPFMLMITSLVVASRYGYNEGISGLAALLILVPYFGALFMLKNRPAATCTFEVLKK